MSTGLTTYEGSAPLAPPVMQHSSDPTGGRLVAWAEGLAAAHRIGSALCQTAFVPASFRGKPEEAAAAILYGDEIGFTPTQALQNIYVISGKPSMYARSMVALVMHHGHEVWTVEKSPAKVTVAGRRRGSNHTTEETWTTARATKAGYTLNKKYVTDPEAMLYARAAADVCRQIAPDALAGLAFSVEEMELTSEPTSTVRRAEAKATAQRKPIEAARPAEPDLDPWPDDDPWPEPAPQTGAGAPPSATPEPPGEVEAAPSPPRPRPGTEPTAAKRSKMFASFRDAGFNSDPKSYSGRRNRLAYIANAIGRTVDSSNELSSDEVGVVIAMLEADAGDWNKRAAEEAS